MDFSLSLQNPLLKQYAFFASVLVIKMLMMSLITIKHGLTLKKVIKKEGKQNASLNKEDIDRVRRSHLNDLENIPVFLFISTIFLLTNPTENSVTLLMGIYTITRILHTLIYAVWNVPQPARGISWGIGFTITFYMAFKIILSVI